MATLADNSPLVGPRRHYIANNAFNNDFFSYTVSYSIVNGVEVKTGTLASVVGASSGNCPKGRILRENGKKLYPGSSVGVTQYPGSSVGVSQYLVGVYDSVTFLNGFINPNSPIFVPMNTDKPHYLADGNDLTGSNLSNQGPAIYTRGDANIDGNSTLGLLGSAITFIKSGSGTSSDPATTGANGISTATLTVQTGCVSGKDFFIFERPSTLLANSMIANFVVSGTAQVTIYIHGDGTGADNGALPFKYTHIRFA